ncbi:craniofacial development protein 2-like protein, partial [Plakobranchus ocellatus]
GVTNFVVYKFGTLAQKEWQTMYDLAKMFLHCLNHWKLWPPASRGQALDDNDENDYKLNYTRLAEGRRHLTSPVGEILFTPPPPESEKGVGIIVDQMVTKAIKGYWALSDRVLLVKIAGKPVDLNIIQVYAPTANSNDEDLDKFYNEMDTAKTQCKSQDPLIIMGDFNAKVGTEKVDDIVGKHGLGIRNERGEKLIEWCQTNNIIVGNTWFQQPP